MNGWHSPHLCRSFGCKSSSSHTKISNAQGVFHTFSSANLSSSHFLFITFIKSLLSNFIYFTNCVLPRCLLLIFVHYSNCREQFVKTVYSQVARESSRPKSCRPKPESCCPKFLVMSPEKKKSSRPKKQILKRSEFQTVNRHHNNNVEKFLSLKRSLFATTPWRFLKCCLFLTTKENVVHSQQQNAALFVWYVIVSYSQTFRKLEKLFLGF